MITIEDLGIDNFLTMFREKHVDCEKALINTFQSRIECKYYKKRRENKIKNIELEDAIQNVYLNLIKAIPKFKGDNFLCFMKFCQVTIKNTYMQMGSESKRKHSKEILSLDMEIYESVELINYIKDTREDCYDEILLEKMIEDVLGDKLCHTQKNYILEVSKEDFCLRTFASKHNISYEYARKLKPLIRKKITYLDGEIRLREK